MPHNPARAITKEFIHHNSWCTSSQLLEDFLSKTADDQAEQLRMPRNPTRAITKELIRQTAGAQAPSSWRISWAKQLMSELRAGKNAA
jgi:hypothetical protein